MIFNMTAFTLFHVLLSLVGIVAGLAAIRGWLHSDRLPAITALFLIATIATVFTGFLFGPNGFTPAVNLGIIALILLIMAVLALYRNHLIGWWRPIFVIAAVASLYLNVFVLVVQAFQKITPLHAFAPTGSEPPFVVVQAAALLLFAGAGYLAVRRFHPAPV